MYYGLASGTLPLYSDPCLGVKGGCVACDRPNESTVAQRISEQFVTVPHFLRIRREQADRVCAHTLRINRVLIWVVCFFCVGFFPWLKFGGSQKGGFQKGGFGGCSPGTKTGTRVRSPKPPFWKPPFYLPITLFGVDTEGWFPEGWFRRMFPRNENRNEGKFAKTTLLRNRPFISQAQVQSLVAAPATLLRYVAATLLRVVCATVRVRKTAKCVK